MDPQPRELLIMSNFELLLHFKHILERKLRYSRSFEIDQDPTCPSHLCSITKNHPSKTMQLFCRDNHRSDFCLIQPASHSLLALKSKAGFSSVGGGVYETRTHGPQGFFTCLKILILFSPWKACWSSSVIYHPP